MNFFIFSLHRNSVTDKLGDRGRKFAFREKHPHYVQISYLYLPICPESGKNRFLFWGSVEGVDIFPVFVVK